MISVTSISEEITYRYARDLVPARIMDGVMTYLINGNWESKEVYDREFPQAVFVPKCNKENPDKRKAFIHNRKCY